MQDLDTRIFMIFKGFIKNNTFVFILIQLSILKIDLNKRFYQAKWNTTTN